MSTPISGGRSKTARESAHRHLARLRAERAARRARLRAAETAAEPAGAAGTLLGPGAWMPEIPPSPDAEPEAAEHDAQPAALGDGRDDTAPAGHGETETSPPDGDRQGGEPDAAATEIPAEPHVPDMSSGPGLDASESDPSVAAAEERACDDPAATSAGEPDGPEHADDRAAAAPEGASAQTGDDDPPIEAANDADPAGADGDAPLLAVVPAEPEPEPEPEPAQPVAGDVPGGDVPECGLPEPQEDAQAAGGIAVASGIGTDIRDAGEPDAQVPEAHAAEDPHSADEPAAGPSAPPAPEGATGTPADTATDLYELPGAGEGLVWLFGRCGVRSLADLAAADPARLAADLGLVAQILDIGYWIEFARKRTDTSE